LIPKPKGLHRHNEHGSSYSKGNCYWSHHEGSRCNDVEIWVSGKRFKTNDKKEMPTLQSICRAKFNSMPGWKGPY
jgi:hypothetical protein